MNVILNGVYNFLNFVNENWTMLVTIFVIVVAIVKKVVNFLNKSQEEKVEIAKMQIREIMLRLVTEAEISYAEWVKSGEIKRAEVIDEIFTMYPILSKIANQDDIISWIDETINEALRTMREIFEKNQANEVAE